MSKVGAIISDALQLLRVTDPDETPDPGQYSVGLRSLNLMMVEPKWQRMPLGWVPVDNPDDDMPVPDKAENAITYALAVELRPKFGVPIDADVIGKAGETFSDLIADRLSSTHNRLDYDLPAAEECNWCE